MSDIYYSPKEYDLKIVDMLDRPDLSWEFEMLGVWQHKDGRLFYASDSGCSCPSPFEDFHSLADLTPITKGASYEAFKKDIQDFHCDRKEKSDLLARVRRRLK